MMALSDVCRALKVAYLNVKTVKLKRLYAFARRCRRVAMNVSPDENSFGSGATQGSMYKIVARSDVYASVLSTRFKFLGVYIMLLRVNSSSINIIYTGRTPFIFSYLKVVITRLNVFYHEFDHFLKHSCVQI